MEHSLVGYWTRLMTAVQTGIQTYNEKALKPIEGAGWDTYEYRLSRIDLDDHSVNNTLYSDSTTSAAVHKLKEKLYKFTRGEFNPVARLIEIIVSMVFGGYLDTKDLSGGALPVVTENKSVIDAILKLFKWSNFAELKSLYVRWAATYGYDFLKVVDEPDKGRVRLEIVHPGKVREWALDAVGNITAYVIEYVRDEEPDIASEKPSFLSSIITKPTTYVYTEKATKLPDGMIHYETLKDGKSFAFFKDTNGQPVSEWDMPYGVMPMVIAQYKDVGLRTGVNAFHHVRSKIDQINDAMSLIHDQMRKSVNAVWYFAGVRAASEINLDQTDASGTKRKDTFPALYGPENSEPHAMIANLPLDQALAVIEAMKADVRYDLPELELSTLREKGGDFTGPGVATVLLDAIGRLTEARANLEGALVRIIQIALTVGGVQGYEGFESITADSYDNGELDFYFKPRPIIPDTLAKEARIMSIQKAATLPSAFQRLVLKELDFAQTEIDDVITEAEAEKQQAIADAARGLGQAAFGDDDEDEDNGDDTEAQEEKALPQAA